MLNNDHHILLGDRIGIGRKKPQPVTVDIQRLLSSRMFISGASNSGKTHTVRRLLEQSYGKVQQIIIDPEGEFSTLRNKFPGYVVGAADGGDFQLSVQSADFLARRLLELKSNTVLDTFELSPDERCAFVGRFLASMLSAPRHLWQPVLVVVDEVHLYAPQNGNPPSSAPLRDLAARGRKRGYGLCVSTQRITKVHKDIISETENVMIGKMAVDLAIRRSASMLGQPFSTARDAFLKLKLGEFFCYGPAFNCPEVFQIKVGGTETRPPETRFGALTATLPPVTDEVREILGNLGDVCLMAEREATTIEAYRKVVHGLRSEIKLLKDKLRESYSRDELHRKVDDAIKPYLAVLHETFPHIKKNHQSKIRSLISKVTGSERMA